MRSRNSSRSQEENAASGHVLHSAQLSSLPRPTSGACIYSLLILLCGIFALRSGRRCSRSRHEFIQSPPRQHERSHGSVRQQPQGHETLAIAMRCGHMVTYSNCLFDARYTRQYVFPRKPCTVSYPCIASAAAACGGGVACSRSSGRVQAARKDKINN
jgi:hypothetical protein